MASVAIIPSTVGFHWEEVFAAYHVFNEAGWKVLFYTVDGKPPTVDPNSIKLRPILSYVGMGVRDSFAPESPEGQSLKNLLNQVSPISTLNSTDIDAIYIPGGHGCLFDVNKNETVHEKILQAYDQGKIIAAICHGTSCLAFVKKDGESIIKGKKVIGFLDSQDKMLMMLGLIDKNFLPLPFWNEEAIREAGGVITNEMIAKATVNPTYYIVDKPFVTGVGPKATTNVAKAVIELYP